VRWSSGCGQRRNDIRFGEVRALEQQGNRVLLGKRVRGAVTEIQLRRVTTLPEAEKGLAGKTGKLVVISQSEAAYRGATDREATGSPYHLDGQA
jgi:hypothetical protein